MEDLKQNWDLILQTFKERYELQDISFNSWIKPIEVYTVENDTITLIMSSTSMNPDMAGDASHYDLWDYEPRIWCPLNYSQR